jgi:predicted nucleic acid-binding protein
VREPVLAEAMFLLTRTGKGQDALFGLLANGALRIALHVEEHVAALRALHRKHTDRPMSLADACIVRMAERHAVLTLDSDFTIYRKHGSQMPACGPHGTARFRSARNRASMGK